MVDRKHILLIVENNEVPGDIRVTAEAKSAKKFGYDVSVICPKSEKYPLRYEQIDGIDIYRHLLKKKSGGKLGFLIEYLNALFFEIIYSVFIYIKKPFHVIHGANPPDLIVFVALMFKPFGVKYIFDHHDIAPELYVAKFSGRKNIMYRILLFLEKLSCKFADAIVTTNNSYKEIVVKRHLVEPDIIKIVRNDPHSDQFKSIENEASEPNKKVQILYLGSINSQDGVDGLLHSLKHLICRLSEQNFICNILGDGESLPSVKELAIELELESYIKFTGFIYERDIIQGFFDKADICVEPAPDNEANRHSTFIKIMEYMAAKKPIVAFDLKETKFSTGGQALLIKSGDTVGFAEAIKKLIDEPEKRKQLGDRGFQRIKEDLNWQRAEENLKIVYKDVISKRLYN